MRDIKLTALTPSELKAAPGMFRPVALIDADTYLIERDGRTVEEARQICRLVDALAAVYDDRGNVVC